MQSNYRCFELTKFIVGRGSIEYLKQIKASRAAVIHGGRSLPESLKTRIIEILSESGTECRFIAKILNEPFFEDIYEVLDVMEEYKPDLLIAIGGGAVMDTAKGIHLFYEHPELALEDALKPYQLPALGATAKMVAIPTTSGTGSETTSAAVFTERKTNRKHLMLADELIPHYAILDADLTDSLPSKIVAHTGMDALTHAMEASVSVAASAMVTTMAISSALDIFENLEASADESSSGDLKKTAREACHVAASLAGVSITNSCAGLAHGFDQPGPWFGLPHGLVCGLLLPYTTAFTGVHPSYVKLAKRLGYKSSSDKELCQMLVDHIIAFNETVGIPRSFSEAGIDEGEYLMKINDFAALAVEAIATKLSPRVPTLDEARDLYKQVFYGENPIVSGPLIMEILL
ncbi:MAG: iron-containing alcohol dehydrogenase [Spirochaetales bacterium]|nr:iron-containing alcohol dehydrogenase [Spirochaetales bacterium]